MSETLITKVAIVIGTKIKPAFEGGRPVSLEEIARAAIEAMREPTEAMVNKTVRDEGAEPEWVKIHWRTMIDAALDKVDA